MKISKIAPLCAFICIITILGRPGVVRVPIADLFGSPVLAQIFTPLESKVSKDCPRLLQLLFHEQVNIIREQGDYLLIDISHLFYVPKNQLTTKVTRYWTHKKNIVPLDTFSGVDRTHFPPIINFEQPSSVNPQPSVVTLRDPWLHSSSKKTFSAGTRFVIEQSQPSFYTVFMLDGENMKVITADVPQKLCMNISTQATLQERQRAYVDLVHHWAHLPDGFIPYVWGGNSYVTQCEDRNLHMIPGTQQPERCHVMCDRHDFYPAPGFDCSGLIARATQCCGIPYFFKNSFTISALLKAITEEDNVEPGDIIWFTGHVMIVSDVHKNTLIESRSLYHGYGRVHEIPLHEEFKNIKTYEQLKEASIKKMPIERLNAHGEVAQKLESVKILKFSSIFKK